MPRNALPQQGSQDLRLGSPLLLRIVRDVGRVWREAGGEGVSAFSGGNGGWNHKDPAQECSLGWGGSQCSVVTPGGRVRLRRSLRTG